MTARRLTRSALACVAATGVLMTVTAGLGPSASAGGSRPQRVYGPYAPSHPVYGPVAPSSTGDDNVALRSPNSSETLGRKLK